MIVSERPKLQANRYLINARWVYLLGILIVGLIGNLSLLQPAALFGEALVWIFLAAVVLNGLNYLLAVYIDKGGTLTGVHALGVMQLTSDMLLIALALYLAGGVDSIIPILFFIPIVEAILIFDFWGPVAVAACSGLLMIASIFLTDYSQDTLGFSHALKRGFIIGLVYIVIGFLAAYIAKLIKERSDLLQHEAAVRQEELEHLQDFNKKLEENGRILAAKESELTVANQRLANLEAAKSKFVSVTTHQLRTPLAAIKWTFNMIMGEQLGPLNAEQKEFLHKGSVSTERMISIVNDLLNVDFIDGEKSDLQLKDTDVAAMLDSVIFEFTNQAESKKIKITVAKPTTPLPPVQLDETKIRIALENLIDNAIKYTLAGGEVKIGLNDDKLNSPTPGFELTVADSGIGIGPEDQGKIFGKFFRAALAVRTEPDGTGLGLYIAKDIVERHGGTLWFESAVGKGTTFHLTLPLHQSH